MSEEHEQKNAETRDALKTLLKAARMAYRRSCDVDVPRDWHVKEELHNAIAKAEDLLWDRPSLLAGYVGNNGVYCPFCASDEIQATNTRPAEWSPSHAESTVLCDNCGALWTERLKLQSINFMGDESDV